MSEVKQITTITQEALSHLRANPSVVADIAYELGRSMGTLVNWTTNSRYHHLFAVPASLKIIASSMGKSIEEITTEKTEA